MEVQVSRIQFRFEFAHVYISSLNMNCILKEMLFFNFTFRRVLLK